MQPAPSFNYGIAKSEDVAGLSGAEMLQQLIEGKLPAPPIAQTLSFWLVEVGRRPRGFRSRDRTAFA